MQVAREGNIDCETESRLPVTSLAMNTFAKRLRSQLDVLGKTTQWLADQSGVSRQAVAQWLEGKTEGARGDAILRAARALSCDPYWLLLGEEADAQGGIRFSRSGAHAANEREHLDEYAFVPRLSVSAGMGPGQELHSEQITDALAFRKAYLEIMGLHAHQALCIRCKGDSMAPTLSDGGVALINMTQRRGDGVFAISRPGVGEEHELVVKRITARMDGGLLISSDNPDKARYPDEVIPPGYDLEAMHIIGRVVWFGGNVY